MREIKFRAWDRENKVMMIFDQTWICQEYESICWSTPTGMPDNNKTYHYRDDEEISLHYELMQFTGIKDKNGVEVYFGDLCKYHDDSGTKQTGVVKSYEYFSGYIEAFGGDDEGNQDIQLHPDYEIEVIGNIYEQQDVSLELIGEIKSKE